LFAPVEVRNLCANAIFEHPVQLHRAGDSEPDVIRSRPGIFAMSDDILIIEAGRSERQYWRDLWRYRELFYVLSWRDMMIRYKQTVVGVLWAFLQPFIPAVVTTILFSRVAHLASIPGVPYFLMVFCGMLPWNFFSNSLNAASQSVTNNASLVSKVYFPRLIVPAGAVVTSLVDFFVTLIPLFGAMAWAHIWPTWRVLFLPVFIFCAFLASLGPGLFLTACNVRYRDFRFLIPFALQIALYITPVMYWSEVLPSWIPRWLYALNPMAGIIEGFRWSICGPASNFHFDYFLISLAVNVLMIWVGVSYFRRTERTFADVI
jgi:lipopolysaccharide transport system permease protein